MLRVLVLAGFSIAASPALADVSIGVGLTLSGDAEIKNATYDCGAAGKLAVQYLNAVPNFLALIPIKDQTLVFVNTLSASGAKYESGQYVWWSKGKEASLYDEMKDADARPILTCTE